MKVDHKRTLDCYRARRGELRTVEVPRLQYLMVDGHGDPNTSARFGDAIAALFPLAYALKFASRRELGKDYAVITPELFAEAVRKVEARGAPAALADVRLAALEEGLCAQTLHVGPFDAEGPVIEQLHRFIADEGLEPAGTHHEIYFSDLRRTAPEKLRTLLRQPVRSA
jgi:hypothetical protein